MKPLRVPLAWVLVLSMLPVVASAGPAQGAQTFTDVPVISGLSFPTAVEFASDGRIFIAEKAGVLKVYEGFNDGTPSVVFDITDQVADQFDRGLLGLALDPGFPTTPYLYTLYSYDAPAPNGKPESRSGRLSRWEIDSDSNVVGPEVVLLHGWCETADTHSVGDLNFGPDGYLYASAGDGAHAAGFAWGQISDLCNDPPLEGGSMRNQDVLTSVGGEAADPVDFDGSMIRIDPMTGAAAPGNPLRGGAIAGDDPVIAHGFRNPYRFVFHPTTGAIYVADVGSGAYEEINVVSSVSDGVVENFGWPCWEGPNQQGAFMTSVPVCQDLRDGTGSWVVNTTLTSAFFEYSHGSDLEGCSSGGSAVTGVAFEDGSNYPADYDGALFFADYARECIFVMKTGAGGDPDPARVELFASGVAVDLVSGPGGDIYYLELFDSEAADPSNTGVLHRFVHSGANQAPDAVISSDPTSGAPPLTVQFDASNSSDPDGDPLTYQWDFDGNGSFDGTGVMSTHIYSDPGTFTARLRVTDSAGASDDATRTINVGNTPPNPTIIAPTTDLTWQVGDPIDFEGTATDVEDGTLSGASLRWQILLHHCPEFDCHEHLEVGNHLGSGGQHVASDHEYPSWLEFILTATDSTGASASTSVAVQPETSLLAFTAGPVGLELVAGFVSTPQATPFTVEAIVGGQVTATAPSPQTNDGIEYAFLNWSDGEAQSHLITVPPVDATYTASFGVVATTQDDVILVEPSGRWHIRRPGESDYTFWYGNPADVPLFGDWNGDGVDTPGMYRPATGFVYLSNTVPGLGEVGHGEVEFFFGLAGDRVFSGDWDGDGIDTLGIARNGRMFLRNSNDTGVADVVFFFGNPTDLAFGGDPDGDGFDGIFLYRPLSGFIYFTNGVPTGDVASTDGSLFFGIPTDRFVIGDWDADQVDTVGVFRPSDTTVYLRNTNSTGTADESYVFGSPTWTPTAGTTS